MSGSGGEGNLLAAADVVHAECLGRGLEGDSTTEDVLIVWIQLECETGKSWKQY